MTENSIPLSDKTSMWSVAPYYWLHMAIVVVCAALLYALVLFAGHPEQNAMYTGLAATVLGVVIPVILAPGTKQVRARVGYAGFLASTAFLLSGVFLVSGLLKLLFLFALSLEMLPLYVWIRLKRIYSQVYASPTLVASIDSPISYWSEEDTQLEVNERRRETSAGVAVTHVDTPSIEAARRRLHESKSTQYENMIASEKPLAWLIPFTMPLLELLDITELAQQNASNNERQLPVEYRASELPPHVDEGNKDGDKTDVSKDVGTSP